MLLNLLIPFQTTILTGTHSSNVTNSFTCTYSNHINCISWLSVLPCMLVKRDAAWLTVSWVTSEISDLSMSSRPHKAFPLIGIRHDICMCSDCLHTGATMFPTFTMNRNNSSLITHCVTWAQFTSSLHWTPNCKNSHASVTFNYPRIDRCTYYLKKNSH